MKNCDLINCISIVSQRLIDLFLFLDSTIDSRFFPDTLIDEKNVEFRFSNCIRAGKYDEIKSLLEMEREKLLNTVYTFHVTFVKKYNDTDIEDDEEEHEATLEISPLHLAIISKQEHSLKAILEESIISSTPSSSIQNSPSINVNKIFGAKVQVTFPSSNFTLYQDGDRMLDGMNILHLAAKYYPEGLESILSFARNHDGLKVIKHLLLEKDNQINNSPLHIAAASSSIVALRYTNSLICVGIYVFLVLCG